MTTVPCKSCKRSVFFAVAAEGRRLPVDPEPTMTGSLVVTEHAGADPTCAVAPLPCPGALYVPHRVTCSAEGARRPGGKAVAHG
jgi:hypothetical protein